MGTGAVVGAAAAVRLGPVETALASAVSNAIGGSIAEAVTGLINQVVSQSGASPSSSSNAVTPGTGGNVGSFDGVFTAGRASGTCGKWGIKHSNTWWGIRMWVKLRQRGCKNGCKRDACACTTVVDS